MQHKLVVFQAPYYFLTFKLCNVDETETESEKDYSKTGQANEDDETESEEEEEEEEEEAPQQESQEYPQEDVEAIAALEARYEDIMGQIVNGSDPDADAEAKAAMARHLQIHRKQVRRVLQHWYRGDDSEKKRKATMVVGTLTFAKWKPDQDGEIIPDTAPKSLTSLLKANQREKVKRLASTVHEKHAMDFFCRKDWPKYDGYYVNINEVTANKSGTQKADTGLKKRSITQVSVLASSEDALKRFKNAFRPENIDASAYDYQGTHIVKEFTDRLSK